MLSLYIMENKTLLFFSVSVGLLSLFLQVMINFLIWDFYE